MMLPWSSRQGWRPPWSKSSLWLWAAGKAKEGWGRLGKAVSAGQACSNITVSQQGLPQLGIASCYSMPSGGIAPLNVQLSEPTWTQEDNPHHDCTAPQQDTREGTQAVYAAFWGTFLDRALALLWSTSTSSSQPALVDVQVCCNGAGLSREGTSHQ